MSAAALANTSATCPVSDISRPKALIATAAVSEASATSPPDTAAKSSTPGIELMISVALKPAEAISSIPAATSVALNIVSAPSVLACSVSELNSPPVACDIAATLDICCSKRIPTVEAAVPMASKGKVT